MNPKIISCLSIAASLALGACVAVSTQPSPKSAQTAPVAAPSLPAPPTPAPSELQPAPVPSVSGIQMPVGDAPRDLLVSVTGVNDMRNQASVRGMGCTVTLTFSGDAVADGVVEGVHVTKAVDDVGRDLIPSGEIANPALNNNLGMMGLQAALTQVRLKNPFRRATEISMLEGEVSVSHPSEKNGGIIHVSHIFEQPGQALADPALQKIGVEITYLTKETYAAKAEQMRAEAGPNAPKPSPIPPLSDSRGQPITISSNTMVYRSGNALRIMNQLPPWNERNVAVLLVRDPGKSVRRLELNDEDGNRAPVSTLSTSGFLILQFETLPQAVFQSETLHQVDYSLQITTFMPGSAQSYPFRLEHIALP